MPSYIVHYCYSWDLSCGSYVVQISFIATTKRDRATLFLSFPIAYGQQSAEQHKMSCSGNSSHTRIVHIMWTHTMLLALLLVENVRLHMFYMLSWMLFHMLHLLYLCIYLSLSLYIYIQYYIYIQTYIYIYTDINKYIYIYVYIHTHVCIFRYTYIYAVYVCGVEGRWAPFLTGARHQLLDCPNCRSNRFFYAILYPRPKVSPQFNCIEFIWESEILQPLH